MAVELAMNISNSSVVLQSEEIAVKEAEKLINFLSSPAKKENQFSPCFSSSSDCKTMADAAVSKFKRVISLLGRTRTGHARFRRAPLSLSSSSSDFTENPASVGVCKQQSPPECVDYSRIFFPVPIQQVPVTENRLLLHEICRDQRQEPKKLDLSYSPAMFPANSFHRQKSICSNSSGLVSSSSGKPPLSSSSFKRMCSSSETAAAGNCSGSSSRCHCSKRRKLKLKRVIRVPAISSKNSDIPPDDYSWRKYGQKPIKGSPHPRGYYKCSSVRGCPARKHIERAVDDPGMLVVTYEGQHSHSPSTAEAGDVNILESS